MWAKKKWSCGLCICGLLMEAKGGEGLFLVNINTMFVCLFTAVSVALVTPDTVVIAEGSDNLLLCVNITDGIVERTASVELVFESVFGKYKVCLPD